MYKVVKFKHAICGFPNKKSYKAFMKALKSRDWSKWHLSKPIELKVS